MCLYTSSRSKIMREHTRPTQFNHPVGSKTAIQHLQNFGGINSCLRTEYKCLAHSFNNQRNDDLITGFDYLACSTFPNMHNRFAQSLKDWHTMLKRIFLSTYHYRKCASNSAFISATYRRVQHSNATLS